MADNETPTPSPETPQIPQALHPAQVGANIVVKGLEGFLRGLGVNVSGGTSISNAPSTQPKNPGEIRATGEAVKDIEAERMGEVDPTGEKQVEDAEQNVRGIERENNPNVVDAIRVLDKSFLTLASYVNKGFTEIRTKFNLQADKIDDLSGENIKLARRHDDLTARLKALEAQPNIKKNENDLEKITLQKEIADLKNQLKNTKQEGGSGGSWDYVKGGLGIWGATKLLGGSLLGAAPGIAVYGALKYKYESTKSELAEKLGREPTDAEVADYGLNKNKKEQEERNKLGYWENVKKNWLGIQDKDAEKIPEKAVPRMQPQESPLTDNPDYEIEKRNIKLTAAEILTLKATNEVSMVARSLKIETEEINIDTKRFILSSTALDALKASLAGQAQQQYDDTKPNMWQKLKGFLGVGPQYTPQGQRIPSGLEMLGQGLGITGPQLEPGGYRGGGVPGGGGTGPQGPTASAGDLPGRPDLRGGDFQGTFKEGTNRFVYGGQGHVAGVNAHLVNVLKEATKDLPPGYHAEFVSGADPRPNNPSSLHYQGRAIDLKIYDDKGKELKFDQYGPHFRLYEQLYQSMVIRGKYLYPGEQFGWLGATAGGAAPPTGDLMHYQKGGTPHYDINKGMLPDAKMYNVHPEYRMTPEEIANYQRTHEAKAVAEYGDKGQYAGNFMGGQPTPISSSQQNFANKLTNMGNKVDPQAQYKLLVDRFTNSPLNGMIPKDGARFGITTGSPQEWARLSLALGMQESSLNPNIRNGLYQFSASDLANYGLGGHNPNDPNVSTEAMVRVFEKFIPKDGYIGRNEQGQILGAAKYFEPIRYPSQLNQRWGPANQVAQSSGYAGPQVAQNQPDATKVQKPVEAGMPGGGYARDFIGGYIDKTVGAIKNWLFPPEKSTAQRVQEGHEAATVTKPETAWKTAMAAPLQMPEPKIPIVPAATPVPQQTQENWVKEKRERAPNEASMAQINEALRKNTATLQPTETQAWKKLEPTPEQKEKTDKVWADVDKQRKPDGSFEREGKPVTEPLPFAKQDRNVSSLQQAYGRISGVPRHNSESYGPTPGSDGYGDGKQNPDGGGGICAI